MKVLIVEDHERMGQFLKQGLSESGRTASLVRGCAQANDAMAKTSFDVIVLDLELPDGDGLDLLRTWRRIGFSDPVLILSARGTVQDRILGLDVGADDYLLKPFSLEELQARVRSIVRRQTRWKLDAEAQRDRRRPAVPHVKLDDGQLVSTVRSPHGAHRPAGAALD
jgi:DNA-binding response OmpR family regulator